MHAGQALLLSYAFSHGVTTVSDSRLLQALPNLNPLPQQPTHVRKWGWCLTVSSSFSRKVRSVASPGRRHSSSCKAVHGGESYQKGGGKSRGHYVGSHRHGRKGKSLGCPNREPAVCANTSSYPAQAHTLTQRTHLERKEGGLPSYLPT